MKLQNVLFSLFISTSVISNAMADTSFSQTQVSFNHIYETAKKTDYEQIFDSDFIFLLYPYSKNDKWLIQDIAQACVNYTTVNTEITTDICKNFVKDIIGVEGTDSTIATDDKFVLTTTANTTEFKFKIFATGNYNIDCGNNTTATKSDTEYTCKYNNAGQYNITVTGNATDYTDNAAISFEGNKKLAKISGSLGAVFPTLPGKQPIFKNTFAHCTSLTEIPNGLFSGISGAPAEAMFYFTFYGCTGLKSIPNGLFSGISGAPAESMFYKTFSGCKGLTEIPNGLFSKISGKPAEWMFGSTFENCEGLTSIPDGLFSKINGEPAYHMFFATFYKCTRLTGTITPEFFGTITPPIKEDYLSEEITFVGTNITVND